MWLVQLLCICQDKLYCELQSSVTLLMLVKYHEETCSMVIRLISRISRISCSISSLLVIVVLIVLVVLVALCYG